MKKIFLISLIFMFGSCSKKQSAVPDIPGIISTVAGNGSGFSTNYGDGGQATAATLYSPWNTAIDNSGNIYIADQGHWRVRKVSGNGIISTFAGGKDASPGNGDNGPAIKASLNPVSVALDKNGNLYIADVQNYSIRKVNPDGIITTVAGNGTQGFAGDGGPANAAKLAYPASIALDKSGNLYIADATNYRIRKVTAAGTISTIAGTGTAGYNGDGHNAITAEIHADAIALDNSGNIYMADEYDNCVRMINTAGIITTIAGSGTQGYAGDGGPATKAALNGPTGVAVDISGSVFICELFNRCIRKISSSGIISTCAGGGTTGLGDGGPATAAELLTPNGVAVDNTGNVFITDLGNNRVRKVSK